MRILDKEKFQKLGGIGKVVEIDEAKFGKKIQPWTFG